MDFRKQWFIITCFESKIISYQTIVGRRLSNDPFAKTAHPRSFGAAPATIVIVIFFSASFRVSFTRRVGTIRRAPGDRFNFFQSRRYRSDASRNRGGRTRGDEIQYYIDTVAIPLAFDGSVMTATEPRKNQRGPRARRREAAVAVVERLVEFFSSFPAPIKQR